MSNKATKPNQLGVNETLELIEAVTAAYAALSSSVQKEEKINAFKLIGILFALNPQIVAAAEGFKSIGQEVKELTEEEFKSHLGPVVLSLVWEIWKDAIGEAI